MINLFKNILIVSPHPDDSEYSCYGLIQKLKTKTTILICSSGGAGDSTNENDRLNEVIDFWEDDDELNIIICKELLQTGYHEIVKSALYLNIGLRRLHTNGSPISGLT